MMCSAFLHIAQVLLHAGSPVRARAWAQEALSLGVLAYGNHHPLVAGAHCIMGQVALDFGEFEHAIGEFEATMEYIRQVSTNISQYSAIAGSFMIQTLLKLGREDDTQSLLKEMRSLSENKIAGEATHFQAHTALAVAQLSNRKGDNDAALSQCRDANHLIRSRFGERHIYRVPFLITRAEILRTAGLLDDSRAELELGLDIMNENKLTHHPQVMACLSALATVSEMAGQRDLAREYRQGTLDGLRACTGPSSPATISAEKELATA
jgi:ATP/maltotriose-dependent transcriptional regulator MalT